MKLEELEHLKRRVAETQQTAARAAGAAAESRKRLLQKFDCKSVRDAERLLKKTESELAALESEFETAVGKFEAEYDQS